MLVLAGLLTLLWISLVGLDYNVLDREISQVNEYYDCPPSTKEGTFLWDSEIT